MGEPRVPAVGSTLTLPVGPTHWEEEQEFEVMPPCEDQRGGHWWCTLHRFSPENNMAVHSHLMSHGDGVCEMVWVCHTHGPEGE